ncbi:hypothetical protein CAOG_02746 [Capsaspora owczarzaki ATCC 30864]|uniref:Uncharacterized protein n=1 Tax=Capsaspora owczarzaki (strain ATCC 30864) TaxID=595528 RepID=A0A0D2VN41_CAPO3|nr:hypothetical protein CAOG_02746 [Capsaspora owczarzaki ATCC 30864]KJE91637.1 hypothetical protein CAOG_002746 [Capsaspora owczarzaki ATCC 30864]|eukprot:XP_004349496.1 hypothetical protein CAOG_02746 [Capsaspora owczarzaki ATCC 30864]
MNYRLIGAVLVVSALMIEAGYLMYSSHGETSTLAQDSKEQSDKSESAHDVPCSRLTFVPQGASPKDRCLEIETHIRGLENKLAACQTPAEGPEAPAEGGPARVAALEDALRDADRLKLELQQKTAESEQSAARVKQLEQALAESSARDAERIRELESKLQTLETPKLCPTCPTCPTGPDAVSPETRDPFPDVLYAALDSLDDDEVNHLGTIMDRPRDARCATTLFERSDVAIESEMLCVNAIFYPHGRGRSGIRTDSRPSPHVEPAVPSRWDYAESKDKLLQRFVARAREMSIPNPQAPLRTMSQMMCDPFVARPPRVAFIVSGAFRALFHPLVHQSLRQYVMDAFGGISTAFFVLKEFDDSPYSSEVVPPTEENLHAVLKQFANSGITIGSVRIQLQSESAIEAMLAAHQARNARNEFPKYRLVVELMRPLIWSTKCHFAPSSWLADPNHLPRFVGQFTDIHDCYHTALDYERETDQKFDWFVRVRADTPFFMPIEPFCRYTRHSIHIPWQVDQFVLAPREFASSFFDIIDHRYWNCTFPEGVIHEFDSEALTMSSFRAHQLQVHMHYSFVFGIMRSTGVATMKSFYSEDLYHNSAPPVHASAVVAALGAYV